ncbi:MAG TPA: hypothetical protein VK492_19905 [Chitinophagaceae bacterium]|nr:hypothetical protein [Chitinophagaceae bacterium]
MNTIFIVIGLIVLVIIVFAVYRLQKVKSQNRKLNEQRFERISPLYNKLEKGEAISAEDVLPYAKNLLTRGMAFHLLSHHDKLNLFPKEYFDIVKGAESNLVNWLEFPTELNACPDEIEHIKRVTFDYDGQNNFVHYEVFKYKVNESHWAAKHGWILGVVGPYFDDSKPYDNAQATFSRVSSTLDKVSPDDEAKWVNENISKRR